MNPLVKANYPASPPLVVAYALAGSTDLDLATEPVGTGSDGRPVFLKEIWPTQAEVQEAIDRCVRPEMFRDQYSQAFTGNEEWNRIKVAEGDLYRGTRAPAQTRSRRSWSI
ncbi:MAG: hypothetical protein U0935_02990 [Pirellulales bacterium]